MSEVGGGDGGAIYTGMYRREISRTASRRETLPRDVQAENSPALRGIQIILINAFLIENGKMVHSLNS